MIRTDPSSPASTLLAAGECSQGVVKVSCCYCKSMCFIFMSNIGLHIEYTVQLGACMSVFDCRYTNYLSHSSSSTTIVAPDSLQQVHKDKIESRFVPEIAPKITVTKDKNNEV